jgi:hypothetical protein
MEYEFTEEENKSFKSLYVSMILISGVFTIFSLILFFTSFQKSDALIFSRAVTFLLFGIILFFPTDNFNKIITTKGNDIGELMTGTKELANGLMFMNIVLVFNRVLIILSVLVSLSI